VQQKYEGKSVHLSIERMLNENLLSEERVGKDWTVQKILDDCDENSILWWAADRKITAAEEDHIGVARKQVQQAQDAQWQGTQNIKNPSTRDQQKLNSCCIGLHYQQSYLNSCCIGPH
jgi:hypothetical protein